MIAIPLIALFSFLPDNTALPVSFQMAGFTFSALAAAPPPIVNETAGERGYQFPSAGVVVTLPAVVSIVEIRACSFAGAVIVEALDGSGAAVARHQVAANQCSDLRLLGNRIATVQLSGGGNEGMIVRMGVAIAECSESRP